MNCGRGCTNGWDVRCCCEFNCPQKNSNLQFKRCNMKINTIIFTIGNDSELYNCAYNDNFYKIQEFFDLTDNEITEIRNLWKEENDV